MFPFRRSELSSLSIAIFVVVFCRPTFFPRKLFTQLFSWLSFQLRNGLNARPQYEMNWDELRQVMSSAPIKYVSTEKWSTRERQEWEKLHKYFPFHRRLKPSKPPRKRQFSTSVRWRRIHAIPSLRATINRLLVWWISNMLRYISCAIIIYSTSARNTCTSFAQLKNYLRCKMEQVLASMCAQRI